MIRAHADAVKALLEGQALTVHEGGAPDSAAVPYAVLWMDSGTRTRETLVASSGRDDLLVTVTSVGQDPTQAWWVAERVFTALLDVAPTVSGRTCSPITHEVSDALRRDSDVTQPGGSAVYQQVDVFRLVSRPA